jgi:hypothetical protein
MLVFSALARKKKKRQIFLPFLLVLFLLGLRFLKEPFLVSFSFRQI